MLQICLAERYERAHRTHSCDSCDAREISACGSLDADERRRLASIMRTIEIASHRQIFTETAPARCLFNVTEGIVKIYKTMADGRRQVTGFLFPGDILGLVDGDSYAYSAESVTQTTLCQFPRKQLEALLLELPSLERRLLGMASHELAAAQDQLVLLGRKSARERVASFLLMLSKASGRQGHPANPIDVPMSRADVADYLGLTVETVSRSLSRLHSQHLIHLMDDKQVHLVDPAALSRIAVGI